MIKRHCQFNDNILTLNFQEQFKSEYIKPVINDSWNDKNNVRLVSILFNISKKYNFESGSSECQCEFRKVINHPSSNDREMDKNPSSRW